MIILFLGSLLFVSTYPFGDIKETLGGYIIVRAESAAEAAEFAKGAYLVHVKTPIGVGVKKMVIE